MTGDGLNGFLKELQKRGIEKMLEGELDGHLDYEMDLQWVKTWYNRRRIHSALGYKTIEESENKMSNQKIAP